SVCRALAGGRSEAGDPAARRGEDARAAGAPRSDRRCRSAFVPSRTRAAGASRRSRGGPANPALPFPERDRPAAEARFRSRGRGPPARGPDHAAAAGPADPACPPALALLPRPLWASRRHLACLGRPGYDLLPVSVPGAARSNGARARTITVSGRRLNGRPGEHLERGSRALRRRRRLGDRRSSRPRREPAAQASWRSRQRRGRERHDRAAPGRRLGHTAPRARARGPAAPARVPGANGRDSPGSDQRRDRRDRGGTVTPTRIRGLTRLTLDEARDKGAKALETFAYRYPEGETQYERFQVHKTIFPRDFLSDFGFQTVRAAGPVELVRLDFGGLIPVAEGRRAKVLRLVREAFSPAPVPQR